MAFHNEPLGAGAPGLRFCTHGHTTLRIHGVRYRGSHLEATASLPQALLPQGHGKLSCHSKWLLPKLKGVMETS